MMYAHSHPGEDIKKIINIKDFLSVKRESRINLKMWLFLMSDRSRI